MLISFRTSSASHFDKLSLQPPDGDGLGFILVPLVVDNGLPKVDVKEISFTVSYGYLESDLLIFKDKTTKKILPT